MLLPRTVRVPMSNAAPQEGHTVRSGVAALDAYVAARCVFDRAVAPPKLMVADYGYAALFRCR